MHDPNHNETVNQILKFFDASRQSSAPSDATRTDKPQGYFENGEFIEPQPSSDPMWVGETLTDLMHSAGIKDPNPEKAAQQKEALTKVVDFLSPQTLGGAALMAAGPVVKLARGARGMVKAKQAYPDNPNYLIYKTDDLLRESDKLPPISQKTGTNQFEGKDFLFSEKVSRFNKMDNRPFPKGTTIHRYDVHDIKHKYKSRSSGQKPSKGYLQFTLTDINNSNFAPGGIRAADNFNESLQMGKEIVKEAEVFGERALRNPKLITNVHFFGDPANKNSGRHAALSLKHVFDRFDDDFILAENDLTMDSFTTMVQTVLKHAEEMEFFPNKKPNLYFASRGSALSKGVVDKGVTGADDQIVGLEQVATDNFKNKIKSLLFEIQNNPKVFNPQDANINVVSKPVGGLPGGNRGEQIARNLTVQEAEDFRQYRLAVESSPFIFKSFKERLAAIFGLQVTDMSKYLKDLSEKKDKEFIDLDNE
tara:strand:+ start:3268 stop:4698 length:1431 start_codon:yes stop_codon:yes gene_type:complete